MWNEFVSGLANFAYMRPKWTDMCGLGALYEKTNFEIGIYSKKKIEARQPTWERSTWTTFIFNVREHANDHRKSVVQWCQIYFEIVWVRPKRRSTQVAA